MKSLICYTAYRACSNLAKTSADFQVNGSLHLIAANMGAHLLQGLLLFRLLSKRQIWDSLFLVIFLFVIFFVLQVAVRLIFHKGVYDEALARYENSPYRRYAPITGIVYTIMNTILLIWMMPAPPDAY